MASRKTTAHATAQDEDDDNNNATTNCSEPRKVIMPKPCPDLRVRTGGFQKIEERTWNVMRSRRTTTMQQAATPEPLSNND
ncbi:hypothetical protein SDRG_10335 [Saprolegnia diclina VS20]|uniref:Uncharacterized protein n=1 Tax=Saprolegnia diclina (strain VS20) TaxID=1156394 RepID=T0QEX3_SAPDV|nr:hypothetical protein SDRG_10335 [Saprolegnia diclina VS20]EQC32140.1 hypothetical protein SDRG_10335 [Saprolegnia diclina VS20]|eukprot:XP_008614542.1 hypothetical protein SDRG_10335 [Saprolegnia diclina VS20]